MLVQFQKYLRSKYHLKILLHHHLLVLLILYLYFDNDKDITPKFFRVLKQFGPFGPGNMKPVFESKNVYDFGSSRLVGKDQEHLKLELTDSSSENVMSGIAFRMYEFNDHLKALNPLDICYTLEENNFNGNTSIQLMIRDIKKVEK